MGVVFSCLDLYFSFCSLLLTIELISCFQSGFDWSGCKIIDCRKDTYGVFSEPVDPEEVRLLSLCSVVFV